MMTKNADKKREQIQMFCMDDMVPQNHMLRLIDKDVYKRQSLWEIVCSDLFRTISCTNLASSCFRLCRLLFF